MARIIFIASGVLWRQYATYASACIMSKASSGYHFWCTHFGCHWRLFNASHCLKLTVVSPPREVEGLPLKYFLFYPSKLSSNDMSPVGWSLVKLASALLHLFHTNRWKLLRYMLCWFQEKWLCLFIFCVMCCLHLVMPLILWRHFMRRYPVLSGQMPSYHVVKRQGFDSYILVTQDLLSALSLAG